VVAVLVVGVRGVADGTIDGVIVAVLALTAWACGELTAPLPEAARALVAARAAAVRLLDVLDAPHPVTDPAQPVAVPTGPLHLSVRDLVVRHPGQDVDALAGVDLDLRPGRRVALVGPSGSGKSTLVDILLRFREPTSGQVGQDGLWGPRGEERGRAGAQAGSRHDMPTVWLVPSGTDSAPTAASGDYLLRLRGDLYEVGKQDTSCTWIGTVAADLLPDLPQVEAPQEAPDQARVLVAVQGVETAETHRGG